MILLACLLHDVDDRKYFPDNLKYENAVKILKELNIDDEDSKIIVHMVDIVSFSKNGDKIYGDDPHWYYIPRYCDRLEATGL